MPGLHLVDTPRLPLARLLPVIGDERFAALQGVAGEARDELRGATVWNVNSTASGGGVAEMLRVIVGYTLDADIDIRWCVISGDPEFFDTTKRIHNQVHGFAGSGPLGAAEQQHYTEVTDALGAEMATQVRPGDVVLLHDPQTAGMAAHLAAAGVHVVWRCHIGADESNPWTVAAWSFLAPHLELCQGFVFSRRAYAPPWLADEAVVVIPPSIDPFSPKNRDLRASEVSAILRASGLTGGGRAPRKAGQPVSRKAVLVSELAPLDPSLPLVVQVSRWDRLKDMPGVMTAFAEHVAGRLDTHLALVGPAVEGVGDDPEGSEVYEECIAAWRALSPQVRRHISLVSLPMEDAEENALMVNAIQRHATVVVQKSLAEGFGLTVAEAMWKARAVVATAVGGIVDQVVPGTGILLDSPRDLGSFGRALHGLLSDPAEIEALGAAARRRVQDEFVGDKHLAAYAHLMRDLHLRPT